MLTVLFDCECKITPGVILMITGARGARSLLAYSSLLDKTACITQGKPLGDGSADLMILMHLGTDGTRS